ncbi:MAG: tetratricopeptide repeat protein [Candidatus Acidiferrales bacterium]
MTQERGPWFWVCLAIVLAAGSQAWGQRARGGAQNALQRDYQQAQSYQAAGKLQAAAVEYRLFVGEALHRIALGQSNVGNVAKVLPLFAEAQSLVPSDIDLRVDYAEACRRAGDIQKAKSLAQDAVNAEPENASAHLTLGRVLSEQAQHQAAIEQFEVAVGLHPDLEDTFALGNEYLRAKEESKAAAVFAKILKASEDSPAVHLRIATAYAERGYPDQATAELKKLIAKDPKYPGAHYSLGAAYLVGASDAMYPQAAEQFREELALHPNDYLSRYQLGHIELSEHKLSAAEADLRRAAELDPANPDAFLELGQLYTETNRAEQAQTALRKSISLTGDVTRNHYQVQRAHYMLARLLLESGHEAEGKAEMQVSQDLLRKSVLQNQGRSVDAGAVDASGTGEEASGAPAGSVTTRVPSDVPPASAEEAKQVAGFEKQIAPAIADSYNNLGAIAAGSDSLPEALDYFEKANAWNPSLPGLDYNWGKAAFTAGQFDEAIAPLGRYVQAHPQDAWARSALGTSEFMLRDYAGAVKTVQPIGAEIGRNVQLEYMYGVSLIRTGEGDRGIAELKAVEAKNAKFAPAHEALGEVFSSNKDFKGAAQEFQRVIQLSPDDFGAKYNLALALIELQRNEEAQTLLVELGKTWHDPHVFYTLGKLQFDRGDVPGAIANLQKAAALSPNSGPIHRELADAYRRAARIEDADREMKLYESLKANASKASGQVKPQ